MLETLLLASCAGCRTMTPMAVMCWFLYLGLLPHEGWAMWAAKLPVVILFTLAAAGEYVGDILPMTPSRKTPPLVVGRLIFGITAASLLWHAMGEPVAGGLVLGLLGVMIGVFVGYEVRMRVAKGCGRDWPAGLLESASVLGLSVLAAWHVHYALLHPYLAMLGRD